MTIFYNALVSPNSEKIFFRANREKVKDLFYHQKVINIEFHSFLHPQRIQFFSFNLWKLISRPDSCSKAQQRSFMFLLVWYHGPYISVSSLYWITMSLLKFDTTLSPNHPLWLYSWWLPPYQQWRWKILEIKDNHA